MSLAPTSRSASRAASFNSTTAKGRRFRNFAPATVWSYSPRTEYPDGELLQSFTAIGTIVSGDVYQVEMATDFKPYRADVRFSPCSEVPIKPLIERLSFIKNKTHWGAAFRFGQLKIPANDFALIAEAMGCVSLAENALQPPNAADRPEVAGG